MISRRDKLLTQPWEQRRYEIHREKIKSAKAAIDRSPPTFYPHILQKAKKQQSEMERTNHVESENIRLLQRLANIMRTKRVQDFWKEPRPNFLSREKLFEARPNTAKTNSIPIADSRELTLEPSKTIKSKRCPTYNGEPQNSKICIPEERIPWQPPHLSFNIKTLSNRGP